MQNEEVTIESVMALTKPTENFLCPQSANTYGIQFVYFKIRNAETDQTLFEVRKQQKDIGKSIPQEMRTVKYHFGPYFFQLTSIGTTLEFKVGPKDVKKFLMIERHYFKNKLIKSYEFQVPFCIHDSKNNLEAIYDLPELDEQTMNQMIKSPWETQSDSFYFVDKKLIMHNKALYNYAPFE